METGTITREMIDEQVGIMLDLLYRVEEGARLWRNQVEDEDQRGALYDIEQAVESLTELVTELGE